MGHSRLNLSALRRGCSMGAAIAAGGRTFSRRQMLGLTGGAVVGTSPALKALEAPFHGPFELVGDNSRVAFVLGGRERWVIDTRCFAGSPSLTVERGERLIRVELKGARYPGTNLSADLRCELRQGATGWRMRLRLAIGGFVAETSLERWLAGREVARSRVQLKGAELLLGKGSHLRLQGPARAEFSPSWELRLSGSGIAQLSGLGEPLVSDSVTLSLLSPDAPSLVRSPVARRSSIRLERGERDWEFEVGRRSGRAWKLIATTSPFDLIEIELGVTRLGAPRRALLATACSQTEESRIFFQPVGLNNGTQRYSGPGGKPFSLPLQNARYAVAFDASGDETALLARYGHSVWLRAEDCTLRLGDHPENEPFELRGERLHCAPALLSVVAPLAGAIVEPAAAPDGARLAFVSDKPVRAHPKSVSRLHLEGAYAGISRLDVTAFSASVLRPDDLLYLRFTSQNLNLQSGVRLQPKIVVADTSKPGYLIVTFQPQSIVEEAYFEADPNYPVPPTDPDTGTDPETPRTPPIPNLMAGTSRLVFIVPKDSPPIPYTLESLLNWNQWNLSVSPLAVQPGAHPPGTPGHYPNPQPPADNQTAIEAPWRLIISPPDQLAGSGVLMSRDLAGQAAAPDIVTGPRYFPAWAHATNAVSHVNKVTNTTSTELWHTRYAARTSSGAVDETAGESLLTLRAIWTPDYYESTRYALNYPFRTSLSGTDRYDIVDLTCHFNPYIDLGTGVVTRYDPVPVGVNRLMLSALGAWLNARGAWNPPEHIISLEEWRHQATMGRDHYVRVVYKGYLFPFGHRASLVKITERKFRQTSAGRVAYLFQREFIVVRQPVKTYNPGDYPSDSDGSYGYAGRNMPFKSVRIATLITPNLDDPAGSTSTITVTNPGNRAKHEPADTVFWPYVGGAPFPFHLVGTDVTNEQIEFTAPLIFIKDQDKVAIDEIDMTTVQKAYSAALSNRQRDFAGQKVAYFDPTAVHIPADEPPDAPPPMAPNLETFTMTFNAAIPPTSVPLPPEQDQPRFYPIMDEAGVIIPAVKRLIGQDSPARIQFNQTVYLLQGLDAGKNPGQVFANVNPPIPMEFGAHNANPDAPTSPGIITPNMFISGLSATIGPIGGTDTTTTDSFGSGTLAKWSDFFGGVTGPSAPTILGGIPLDQILADHPSPKTAPRLTHTVPASPDRAGKTEDVDLVEYTLVSRLKDWPEKDPIFFGHADADQGKLQLRATIKQPQLLSGPGGGPPPEANFEIAAELTYFTLDFSIIILTVNTFGLTIDKHGTFAGEFDLRRWDLGPGVLKLIQRVEDWVIHLFGGSGGSSGGSSGSSGGGGEKPGIGVGPAFDVVSKSPPVVAAGVNVSVPSISIGAFRWENIKMTGLVTIPLFHPTHPTRWRFELAQREQPFKVGVYLFDGGGSFAIEGDFDGKIQTVEGQVEFGAGTSLDLGVASGRAEVAAGIYFHWETTDCSLTGYVRMAGSLSVLHLITASIEFYMSLTYDFTHNVLYGEATVTVSIHIGFISKSVDLEATETFVGSDPPSHTAALRDMAAIAPRPVAGAAPQPISAYMAPSDWTEYCAAFA